MPWRTKGKGTDHKHFKIKQKYSSSQTHLNTSAHLAVPKKLSVNKKENPLFVKAKTVFGTTKNPQEAGYILPDGSMLDSNSKGRGARWFDHSAQAEAIGTTVRQLKNEGAIRFVATSREANLEFTDSISPSQWDTIQNIFSNNSMMEAIRADVYDKDGKLIAYETFLADKIFERYMKPDDRYKTMQQFENKYVGQKIGGKQSFIPPKVVCFKDDTIAVNFDGQTLSSKIKIVPHEVWVASWSKSPEILIDNDLPKKYHKSVAVHEVVEKYLHNKYGLDPLTTAHHKAEEIERKLYLKTHTEKDWSEYSKKVDAVSRKETAHLEKTKLGGKVEFAVKSSSLHGIGIFANQKIRVGTKVKLKELKLGRGLNWSEKPNVKISEDGKHAVFLRDVRSGEEITTSDYRSLSKRTH